MYNHKGKAFLVFYPHNLCFYTLFTNIPQMFFVSIEDILVMNNLSTKSWLITTILTFIVKPYSPTNNILKAFNLSLTVWFCS